MNRLRKLLFIRVDRIGDLVLTLPVDQSLDTAKNEITWWISQGLEFIAEASQKKRTFLTVNKLRPWREFWRLYSWLKANPTDVSILFHGPWWLSLACFLAGVPTRGGRLSQWHSYLFLNKGLRQSRSQSAKHESEYNFELASYVLSIPYVSKPHLELRIPEAGTLLKKFNLEPKSYLMVHPGMGGSSRNANSEYYISLISKYLEKTIVVITGTKSDLPFIAPLFEKLRGFNNIIWLNEKLSGREVIAVAQEAQMVIAPSTGVMHLAASTGVKTLGIFSPVQTQSSKRWGPRGRDVSVIAPTVTCPGVNDCQWQACPYFDCMDTLPNLEITPMGHT
ncbi:MAG: glycosyltransferase family 9 protein [Pseudomonadota bacterium]|nr:glycosyltransferase family 9 protein [Pseudomonadota bacterium]